MSIELPEPLEQKLALWAKKFGVQPQTILTEMVKYRIHEYETMDEGDYPPDDVIAAQVAEDPDAAPILSEEEMRRSYVLCEPLVPAADDV